MSGRRGALWGRDRELDVLAAALDQAAAGAGAIVLLSGEPGIGKTRLLEEVAARASTRGFAVAWGRAWEVGLAPTYWPWTEALRALVARPGAPADVPAPLARLLPELAGAAGTFDDFQILDAVASFLRARAVREPLAILLDDLHAADPSSLQLAELVARRLRDARIALFASHRDVEARRAPEVGASLQRLARGGEVLALARLGEDDVGELVREATGATDAETTRMIHAASDGNPLFVRELLRLLAAKTGASRVPEGVRAVIRERLALLSPATVALLQAASVVGREWALPVAAEVAGVTSAALADASAEAEEAELLVDAGAGRRRFSHALVAETLAADLPAPVRAKLHRRAAETLAARHAGDPAAPTDAIAHHWLEAGPEHAAQALAAASAAADAALARLAFADAAAMYARARGALALAAPADASQRAALLVAEGEALVRAGDRARGEATCKDAAELARKLGDGVLLARAGLALGAEVAVATADRPVIRLLEEALRLLPPGDGSWRARAMARLAGALQPQRDPRPPMALAREAIAMARRLGDETTLLHVLHAAMGALMDYAPPAERRVLNAEVARLAAAAADRPRGLRANLRLAFDCVEALDLPGFEAAQDAYDALAAEVRQPRYQWITLMLQAMRAGWEGRLAEAARLYAEARTLDQGANEIWLRDALLAASIEDAPGLDAGLEAVLRGMGAGAAHPEPFFEVIARTWMHARNHRLAEARALAATLPEGALVDAAAQLDLHMATIVGDIAVALGDRALAAADYQLLLPVAGQGIAVTGIGFVLAEIVDHQLLRLAHVGGLPAAVVDAHAEAGLAGCARLGARVHAARLRADWATALAERGEGPRARALAAEARVAAEELGMPGLVQRIDRTFGTAPGAPAATPAPTPSEASLAPLTLRREGDYWTVSGRGELCRVRDTRGLQMLARLVEAPGRELHVLDLGGAPGAADGGDAGEVLDATALAAYRERLRELDAELAEAEEANDRGRHARLAAEAEALRDELSAAVGLGGKTRRTASAVERARVNVRRRLADAMRRIEEACPALGKHLAQTLRTGTYCAYEP